MKLPIFISLFLFLIATASSIWITEQDFTLIEATTLIVYIATAFGALVSAVFVVYGYFVNLSVFKESQKPRLLLQIHNDRAVLEETGENVHQTVFYYANISQNECRELNLKLTLITGSDSLEIPRLFSSKINIGPNDSRKRDFPTLTYFRNNGIPKAVINELEKYKLRASYSYIIMGEKVCNHYDYVWNHKKESWGIV